MSDDFDKSSFKTYLTLHNNSSNKNNIHSHYFDSIFGYTKYSKTLNSHLWKKAVNGIELPAHIQRIQDKLDDAIKNSKKVSDSFIVYSGVKNRKNTMPSHLSEFGEVLTPSYISASTSPRIAHSFSEKDENGNTHILRIRVPNNFQHGAFVANMSEHPYEKEFLIQNNRPLLIHSTPTIIKHNDASVHIWDAEIK